MSRLRRLLSKAGGPGQAIATDPAGYRLKASTETLDLLQFRALIVDARAAVGAGRHEQARERYRTALGLWRGPALAGIDRPAIRRAATALDEERAQALEERIDLALGASGELISELTDLIQRYPYRERLHAALMIALYRADRRADALAAYQRIRQILVNELGQEPGPALRDLHHRILIADDTLRPRKPNRSAEPARSASCLPRTLQDFTGREADLAWLVEAASRADPYAPLVLAIDGMPGVGKTSLVLRVAHELAPNTRMGSSSSTCTATASIALWIRRSH
jgi:DNA-binding SARP family transcriptional activator